MSCEEEKPLVVGYAVPKKKVPRMKSILFDGEPSRPIEYKELHLTETKECEIEDVDVLLHKFSHDMVIENSDGAAKARMDQWREIIQNRPNMMIMDPLSSVFDSIDRGVFCEKLASMESAHFSVPPFVVIRESTTVEEKFREAKLQLPVICKSTEACGTQRSHEMSVISDIAGIKDVEAPVVLQRFVNHGEKLIKAYVIGDTVEVAERRSLPNLEVDCNSQSKPTLVKFDTQKEYPSHFSFYGRERDTPSVAKKQKTSSEVDSDVASRVRQIAADLRKHFGLTLFGFDVLIEEDTDKYFVVDINYFPSYTEMKGVGKILGEHILSTFKGGAKA